MPLGDGFDFSPAASASDALFAAPADSTTSSVVLLSGAASPEGLQNALVNATVNEDGIFTWVDAVDVCASNIVTGSPT